MKNISYKTKLIVALICLAALVVIGMSIVRTNKLNTCQDIIGDGYYMGTDPEPVVIGNTCDSKQ